MTTTGHPLRTETDWFGDLDDDLNMDDIRDLEDEHPLPEISRTTAFPDRTSDEHLSLDAGIARLHQIGIAGIPMQHLAMQHRIHTHGKTGKINKGWIGLTVEAALGQRPNTRRGMDFGDWELKTTTALRPACPDPGQCGLGSPCVACRQPAMDNLSGWQILSVETLDPHEVMAYPFMASPLREKIERTLLAVLTKGPGVNDPVLLVAAKQLILDGELLAQIATDYGRVRQTLLNNGGDISELSASLGKALQVRPKGAKNSRNKGFYLVEKAMLAAAQIEPAWNPQGSIPGGKTENNGNTVKNRKHTGKT